MAMCIIDEYVRIVIRQEQYTHSHFHIKVSKKHTGGVFLKHCLRITEVVDHSANSYSKR